jgi:hypothetical protein
VYRAVIPGLQEEAADKVAALVLTSHAEGEESMNLEEWGSLKAFESIIPCTTPTWALYRLDDGTPYMRRVLAWKVEQSLEDLSEGTGIWASMTGFGACEDGSYIGDLKEPDNDFVCYLDESERAEAQERVDEWYKGKVEAEARRAQRQAAKAAEGPRA